MTSLFVGIIFLGFVAIGLLLQSCCVLLREREELLKRIESLKSILSKQEDESQDQMVQSSKMSMIGELVGSVVHDLRNPLTVISGYNSQIEMMLEAGKVKESLLKKAVTKNNFALERINRLVDRMNRFNRVEVKMEEGISLKETIENSLVLVENKVRNSGCKLECKWGSDDLTFWGDSGLIEQVVMNLVSNAIDAMEKEESKSIEIECGDFGEKVFVRITDTGSGISPENLSKLYQSFFTTKEAGKGTGLGLSVVFQLIEKHCGGIEVESELGYGTSFQIILNSKSPAGSCGVDIESTAKLSALKQSRKDRSTKTAA